MLNVDFIFPLKKLIKGCMHTSPNPFSTYSLNNKCSLLQLIFFIIEDHQKINSYEVSVSYVNFNIQKKSQEK